MNIDVWAEVARAFAIFIAGFAGGMVTMAIWHHRAGDRVTLNRALAVAIFVVVSGTSLLGVWNSYHMREQARCQSQVNGAFLETLAVNVELAAEDRENLDGTVERLVDREAGDSSSSILADYLAERDRIERQREEYPELPQEVCE